MKSALALLQTLVFAALAMAADAPALPQAAPFYTMPAVGTWAEFECTSRGASNKETVGALHLRRLADSESKGEQYAWVEIKLVPDGKAPASWKLRRLVVSVERYRQTGDLTKSVAEAYQQSGADDPARRMEDAPLASFLRMAFARPMPLEKQGEMKTLTTPAGKWRSQKLQGSVTEGDRRESYAVWQCPDAPFGCSQFTVTVEQTKPAVKTDFRAVLIRTGTSAP